MRRRLSGFGRGLSWSGFARSIPPTALFAVRADEGFVYVVGKDRKVRARKVSLGPLGLAGSEVLSGLATGETIVTSSLDRMREGLAIDPVRPAP